jgi:hypothetical protein
VASFVLILTVQSRSDGCHSFFFTITLLSTENMAEAMGKRMGALVLGLRCSNLETVSSYDITTMRRNRFANL